jgi:hypothetical protein
VNESKMDETLVLQPVVRALETEAINLYRGVHPDGPLWQDLQSSTRHMWVDHAEKLRKSPPSTPKQGEGE